MVETAQASQEWFRLDNAAKLYPAIATARWTSMFRLSFVMKEQVDAPRLERAVNEVLRRFPTFRVRLRRGLFWYYLEENPAPFWVKEDGANPCEPFRREENSGYLFRVLYWKKRISIEVFHALADGTGGLVFLKTVVAQYLRLGGVHVPAECGVTNLDEAPRADEIEDAYRKVGTGAVHASRKEPWAYMMDGTREVPAALNVISARIPVDALKARAKVLGLTITEYLTAVMIYTLWQRQQAGRRQKKLPVKVSVPVNMRKFVETRTVRNFAFYVNVGIDPRLGSYTFEEVAALTHHYLRYAMNPKFLFAGIATNVASERNPLIRICPLPLKNFVLSGVYHRVGETLFTTTLTNVGAVAMPEGMDEAVERCEMLLGPSSSARSSAAAVSVHGELCLTFTRNIRETYFERDVCRYLVAQGVPVTVSSNQEGSVCPTVSTAV